MDQALSDALKAVFGNLATQMGLQLDPIYGGATRRFVVSEALALDQYLRDKQYAKAKELIRSRMTADELNAEKAEIVLVKWGVADSQASGIDFTNSLVAAGLRFLLFAALGMVGL